MKLKTLLVLAMIGLCGILTAPLGAQSLSTRFSVPFEFVMAGKTVPAGECNVIYNAGGPGVLMIQSIDGHNTLMTVTHNGPVKPYTGKATLVFHRYADRYFLAEVTSGLPQTAAFELPETRAEKEASKVAALQPMDTVTLIASR